MPEKDGDEAKSTKSVVNKKQKQMMGEMRQEKKIIPSGQGLTDYSKGSIPSVRELGGLGGGGGGTNSITDKAKTKTFKNYVKDVIKIATFPISRRNIKRDPTEKFASEEFSDRQRSDMKNLLTKNFGDESTAKNTAIKVKASRAKEITGQSAVRDSQKYASGEYAKLGGGERMSLKMKGSGAATAGANPTKTGGPKENPKSLGGKSKGNTPVKVDVKKKPDMSKYFGDEYIPEEGYDIARDMGKVRPSKDKKDATTMPPSKEMEKTRKVVKGPSALERVKKKYKGQIMKVEELDLTKVAEAFGGYIIEANGKSKGRGARSGGGNQNRNQNTRKNPPEGNNAPLLNNRTQTMQGPGVGPDQYTDQMRKNVERGRSVFDTLGISNPRDPEIYMTKDGKFTTTKPPETDNEVINQKPSGFAGDTPPSKEKIKPVKQRKLTTGSGADAKDRGDTVTYGQPDQVKPKQGKLSKLATAAAANPAAALIAYDLGKGIIGKIKKLRAPAVVGGKAGFRSAGGYQAT